jgi:hypothetical protein
MAEADDEYDDTDVEASWSMRLRETFWPSPPLVYTDEAGEPAIIPLEGRKAAMSSLDGRETRLSSVGYILGALYGIALPVYYIVNHIETKAGNHRVTVGPDALLLGGAILVFSILGFIALWKRKRTMVAFLLFLVGLGIGYTIFFVGLIFILLGGWLMLSAWRINRYGTTNSKMIRQEVASRPRGKGARTAPASTSRSRSSGKSSTPPGARKAPTASKRYTPKAPPRKKIPKPTQ